LTAQTQPAQPQSGLPVDRTTAIGIGALVIAILILIGLIGLITLLPAQTITRSMSEQASQQERLLASSLGQQMESFFSGLSFDLVGLANRPEIKALTKDQVPIALASLAELAQIRQGQIKSLVRIDRDGLPIYAWPDSYNEMILAKQPLPWSVDKSWVENIAKDHNVHFTEQRLTNGGVTYMLAGLVTEGSSINEVLALEINLDHYFDTNFKPLKLSPSGQLWIFDPFGNEIYHFREQPAFRENIKNLTLGDEATGLSGYPTSDRESVVMPVNTTFYSNSADDQPMLLVLSRAIGEGQQEIYSTLQTLFLFGLGIIGFIVAFGLLIGRFLLRETGRRRQEEQRRSTARTLLEMSRALNSSLDLNVVLQRILGELGSILPHDNASILLLNDENKTLTVAAEAGRPTPDHALSTVPLNQVRGAREVVMTAKPVVINDCATDPRWRAVAGSNIRAWLGVPLRVQQQAVGVLNINSFSPDRFLPDDIDLAEAFADQASVAIQNARAHEFQIRVFETELETARAIQTSLLPQEEPPVPQAQIAARSIPARHVSGDYYQYYVLPDGKLGIAIGDVSGKGIPAALLMAVVTATLREEIIQTPAPAELLKELNTRLLSRMQQNHMNSALIVSIFDPLTRHLELANAGMVQPYVRNGSTWEAVPVGGYPLGAAARSAYSAKTVTLAPGSMLVLVSDGVVEAQNLKQELFGFEKLEALLADLPADVTSNEVADTIMEAVKQHVEGQDPQDDITVVVMKSVEI
jgi:serine phosphatase RsbU (regulator of sigma subunit)